MVFYVEACESGSMFNKLLKPNINGKESSLSFEPLKKQLHPKQAPL